MSGAMQFKGTVLLPARALQTAALAVCHGWVGVSGCLLLTVLCTQQPLFGQHLPVEPRPLPSIDLAEEVPEPDDSGLADRLTAPASETPTPSPLPATSERLSNTLQSVQEAKRRRIERLQKNLGLFEKVLTSREQALVVGQATGKLPAGTGPGKDTAGTSGAHSSGKHDFHPEQNGVSAPPKRSRDASSWSDAEDSLRSLLQKAAANQTATKEPAHSGMGEEQHSAASEAHARPDTQNDGGKEGHSARAPSLHATMGAEGATTGKSPGDTEEHDHAGNDHADSDHGNQKPGSKEQAFNPFAQRQPSLPVYEQSSPHTYQKEVTGSSPAAEHEPPVDHEWAAFKQQITRVPFGEASMDRAALADNLFAYDEVETALALYQALYKQTNPNDPKRDWYSYQMAACQRRLKHWEEASKHLREVSNSFHRGLLADLSIWWLDKAAALDDMEQRTNKFNQLLTEMEQEVGHDPLP